MPVPSCRSAQIPANAGKTISMAIAVTCEVHAMATAIGERSSEESFTRRPINRQVSRAEFNRQLPYLRAVGLSSGRPQETSPPAYPPPAYRLRKPANQRDSRQERSNLLDPFPRVARPGTRMAGSISLHEPYGPPKEGFCRVISQTTFDLHLEFITVCYLRVCDILPMADPRYPQNPIIAFSCVTGYNQNMSGVSCLPGLGRVLPVASGAKQTT